jgi:MFS transporter, AAHS family, 4-hydroxybenzoate transporter
MQLSDRSDNVASYNPLLFAICIVSGICCGLTSALAPSYLPVMAASFDLQQIEKLSAIINASFIYGMLAGGLLIGFLGDRSGRKPAFIVATLLTGLFTLLVFFSQDWRMLVACRFFSGAGTAGVLLTTAILIAEEWPAAKER